MGMCHVKMRLLMKHASSPSARLFLRIISPTKASLMLSELYKFVFVYRAYRCSAYDS